MTITKLSLSLNTTLQSKWVPILKPTLSSKPLGTLTTTQMHVTSYHLSENLTIQKYTSSDINPLKKIKKAQTDLEEYTGNQCGFQSYNTVKYMKTLRKLEYSKTLTLLF